MIDHWAHDQEEERPGIAENLSSFKINGLLLFPNWWTPTKYFNTTPWLCSAFWTYTLVIFPELIWYWSFSEILFLPLGITEEFWWGSPPWWATWGLENEWVSGGQFPTILGHSPSLHQIGPSVTRCLPRCSHTGRGAAPQINLMKVPAAFYISSCSPLMPEFIPGDWFSSQFCLMLKCMVLGVFLPVASSVLCA